MAGGRIILTVVTLLASAIIHKFSFTDLSNEFVKIYCRLFKGHVRKLISKLVNILLSFCSSFKHVGIDHS